MSGTHIADSNTLRKRFGGKVIGKRMTRVKMPSSQSTFQNGLPLRSKRMSALRPGSRIGPSLRGTPSGTMFTDESNGKYVRTSRVRKSNMLCLPGLHPVRKVDQATGESGGAVVASF